MWFQIFRHILVTDRNVLSMFKTFRLHLKWRNIEQHWKYILTAVWLLSKYSYSIPTAFHTFWSHSRENLLYPFWPHFLHQLIKHGRLHPELVVESLWVYCSELIHQSGIMSIHPPILCIPAMDGSDIFWVFSSSLFSWPSPHLFQADHAVE